MVPLSLLQSPASADAASAFGSPDGIDLTRYLLVCGGLIALTLLLAWALKRFVGVTLRAKASQRSLEVLDVLPLGSKRQLSVVRCYDRSFLLGLGEREVNLIAELEPRPDKPAPPQVDELFRRALARAGARRAPEQAQPAGRPARAASGTRDAAEGPVVGAGATAAWGAGEGVLG